MTHITEQDTRSFDTHGVTFTSFVSSATGAASLGAWRADFAPQTPGLAHSMDEEEVLHVLSGRLDIEIDDDAFVVGQGETVFVPAGARFRVSNATAASARAWVVTRLGMTATMEGGETLCPPWAR